MSNERDFFLWLQMGTKQLASFALQTRRLIYYKIAVTHTESYSDSEPKLNRKDKEKGRIYDTSGSEIENSTSVLSRKMQTE